jgi:hypothetical protein
MSLRRNIFVSVNIHSEELAVPWLPSCFPQWDEWQCDEGACEACREEVGVYEPGTEPQLPPAHCSCEGGCRSRYISVPYPIDFSTAVFRETAGECLPGEVVRAANAPELALGQLSEYGDYLAPFSPPEGGRWIFQDWNLPLPDCRLPEPEDMESWDPDSPAESIWIRLQ